MSEKFRKPYDPNQTEDRIYQLWEESGFFNPDVCIEKGVCEKDAETFSMVLPPPNETGILHIGHAAMLSIEDIMVRFNRMQGKRTLWIPGTDHAAIATNARVEKELAKKKIRKHDIGREAFLKQVAEFTSESRGTILEQTKKMGSSLDWSRLAYTLDKEREHAVNTAFKKLYDLGLIYRGHRIVNWDPRGQTVISDDELVRKEETAPFYYLKYGPFTIGTARPETKFGDKYVVMHPDDKRYNEYTHGQEIELEWINGPITATIIKDEAVDMEFGTGAMTITPWHDATDFDIAERHNLDKEQIIDKYGKLLPVAGEFEGMKIQEAREKIVEKLEKKGLVEKIDENYTHQIATAERTGGIIEPQIMEQWFIDVNKTFKLPSSEIPGIQSGQEVTLKELMLEVVREDHIEILPERFEKIYFHWVENLRDWCISRQIWFGHQIPVWYRNQPTTNDEQPTTVVPERVMGFHERTVPQVLNNKTKTYRLRDHHFSVEDEFMLENSQTRELFGTGTMTNIEKVTVKDIDLQDEKHGATYDTREELIEAFKFHHPHMDVTEDTPVWVYTYTFKPFDEPLTRDPDTLDTWFSSGLWTFSTLGWPEETGDLKTYHPTTVLETGYDILFFWVARMILMSTTLTGQIPFKTVYLHGLVRDAKGQKISKSLGNNIDPVNKAEQFGTDALRMSLIVGVGPGSDNNLSDEKITAYKKFANKLWNIARFVLENTEDMPKKKPQLTANDQKRVDELEDVAKEITDDCENYRLYLAGEKLYHYVWHTLADEILEERKDALNGEDVKAKQSAQYTLYSILTTCLKLLHPFMPFITEEIWQELPEKETDLLMIAKWTI